MHPFKDGLGREWQLALSVGSMKRVRALTGTDLFKVTEGELKPLAELLGDLPRFVDVLWFLVKPDADKLGVTDEDFGSAFFGDTIERAVQAFQEELVFFTPNDRVRQALTRVFAKGKEVADLALADTLGRADRALETFDVAKAAAELTSRWNGSATVSPASPASTPTP